jgi:hypothetical protein
MAKLLARSEPVGQEKAIVVARAPNWRRMREDSEFPCSPHFCASVFKLACVLAYLNSHA